MFRDLQPDAVTLGNPLHGVAVRVLCIDTIAPRRSALRERLEEAGFEVQVAAGVDDALAFIATNTVDAVLADQSSTERDDEEWIKLFEVHPQLLLLVHSATPPLGRINFGTDGAESLQTGNPDILVALLALLFWHTGRNFPDTLPCSA